jgi:histidyl-tRNA synthetase
VERVRMALESAAARLPAPPPTQVLVAAEAPEQGVQAMQVAHALRQQGIAAELDVRERTLRANLDYANRRGIPYVLAVGADLSALTLRRMADGREQVLALAEVKGQL